MLVFAAAVELAAAYAQRWEIELSFDEIENPPNRE
jgi:IS4 transposase